VDHSRPCCTLCATLPHRKCETVISVEHQETAFTLSVLNWQGSQSFSDVVIACLSTKETSKLFSGKLFAHASMLFFLSPSVTILHSRPCCTLCATLSHRKCETVISIDTAAAGIKQSTITVDLSNELQQKSQHIDEMIENRKENIGVAFCIKSTGMAQLFRLYHSLLVNHGNDQIIKW
jgi:hypothetical protein